MGILDASSPILADTPPVKKREPRMRSFADPATLRDWVYEKSLNAAREIKPWTGQRYTVALSNVDYTGKDRFTAAEQKQALLRGNTLGRKLRGTWTLTDNTTGQPVESKTTTLGTIPFITDRGTLIDNGTEYTINNQIRLRPGIFTRRKENGEIESHINVLPGEGRAHRYHLDPARNIFYADINQAKIPLLPLLRAMGANDAQLREAWGDTILGANLQNDSPVAINKFYERLLPKSASSLDDAGKKKALAEVMAGMRLDPEVVRRTLGRDDSSLSLDTILATTKKLLAISRGESEIDDRDNLAFKSFYGPEDLIAERLSRDYGGIQRNLARRAAWDGNLKQFTPGMLNKQIRAALLSSGLGQALEEINPADVFDKLSRVSQLGEGGIPSIESVPDEARSVQPSHLAFIDPVRTPESAKVGVDAHIARTAMKGDDGQIYSSFVDARTGETVYRSPKDVADLTVAFPGELAKGGKRVWAMQKGRLRWVPRTQVDVSVPHFENAFNSLANLIPFKSATKGQRVAMGSRMITQALPLVKAEAPLVQSGVPDQPGESFESLYGKQMGALRSSQPGRILQVSPDSIKVQYADGTTEDHELYNEFPYNRKTRLHQTPVVKPGDIVQANQLLAKSNYTDDTGSMAVGLNARTAYLPYQGKNFEDAVVISQSLAERLTSEHTYQHRLDKTNDHKLGRSAFVGLFPQRFDRRQLDSIDANGIVKPGTQVTEGDPLILGAVAKAPARNRVHKRGSRSFGDSSVTWDHHSPGVVTDVVDTDKGITVVVKSTNEMKVGDKLSGRYGDKGVVACYDDQTQLLTSSGWRSFAELTDADLVASKCGDHWQLAKPRKIVVEDYDGELCCCEHERLSYAVTPNHRMSCRTEHYRGKTAEYKVREAADVQGKRVYHRAAIPFHGGVNLDAVVLEQTSFNNGKLAKNTVAAATFCRFLGWWLSEGNLATWSSPLVGASQTQVTSYKVQISQSRDVNPLKCREIEDVLNDMGVGWHYSGCQYTFSNKAVWSYLSGQGGCTTKHVPREILENASQYQLEALLQSLLAGDGSVRGDKGLSNHFTTTSSQLADDVQEIAARLGLATVARSAGTSATGNHDRLVVTVFFARPEVGSGSQASKNPYSMRAYRGKVYCVDVGGEGIILVRRNGKPFWCGNSIVPDDRMPHDRDGKPFELLLNPNGIISRTNPSQYVEAALGKIAAVTGKPYRVPDFESEEDLVAFAQKELQKHGLTDVEEVIDPTTGKLLRDADGNTPMAGHRFVMKLHHTAEDKGSGRGTGGYTAEDTPAKGGESGSKRIGMLNVNALLSHGATAVIRDASGSRGQSNQDMWLAFQQGHSLPEPKIPFVYQKAISSLKAAGINVVPSGSGEHVMAMTDRDIDELAGNREVKSAETVDLAKGMEPVPGGLFDPALTGGNNGDRWSFIRLAEPMPNPVMEEPIRRLLGLTQKKFEDVLAGRETIQFGGAARTGPEGIAKALQSINVDRELAIARSQIAGSKKTVKDQAIRKLGYLKSAKRLGINPGDWVLTKVPVLPPRFRPISVMSDSKIPLVSDPNYLYRELINANDNLRGMLDEVDDVTEERASVYSAFKAVTGLGDPVHPKLQEKGVRGILKHVFGSSPKFGMVQRRLLSSTVDLVGRGVITPNPDLDMDSVGLPESKAWDIYEPFIVRRLKRQGLTLTAAKAAATERTAAARKAMLAEMEDRPVFVDRAPVLHRFGVMAFKPRLTKSETVEFSPLIVQGFVADFDGDAVQYHVPLREDAKREALERMLPSKNLLSPADFKTPVHMPGQEYVGGLFEATAKPNKKRPARRFQSRQDAIKAYLAGEIDVDTPVHVSE